jgi:hypothetical protein
MPSTPALLSIAIAVLIVGASLYRFSQMPRAPIGLGYNSYSPDKQYRAYATTLHQVSFFGRRTAFYEFELEDCQGQRTIAKHRTSPMPEAEAVDLSEPCIYWWWEPDARRVRIALRDKIYWEHDIVS